MALGALQRSAAGAQLGQASGAPRSRPAATPAPLLLPSRRRASQQGRGQLLRTQGGPDVAQSVSEINYPLSSGESSGEPYDGGALGHPLEKEAPGACPRGQAGMQLRNWMATCRLGHQTGHSATSIHRRCRRNCGLDVVHVQPFSRPWTNTRRQSGRSGRWRASCWAGRSSSASSKVPGVPNPLRGVGGSGWIPEGETLTSSSPAHAGNIHWRNTAEQLKLVGPASLGVSLLTAGFVGMVFTIQVRVERSGGAGGRGVAHPPPLAPYVRATRRHPSLGSHCSKTCS